MSGARRQRRASSAICRYPIGPPRLSRGEQVSASVLEAHTTEVTVAVVWRRMGAAMLREAGAVVGMLFLAHATAGQFVQQGEKLVSEGLSYDTQGQSVAISGDGNTAIIGLSQANAAYVFVRSGDGWSQQGNVLLGSFGSNDGLGFSSPGNSVALSVDGNTAIVGGQVPWNGDSAAWVFTRSDGVWSQQGSMLSGTDAAGSGPGSGGALGRWEHRSDRCALGEQLRWRHLGVHPKQWGMDAARQQAGRHGRRCAWRMGCPAG